MILSALLLIQMSLGRRARLTPYLIHLSALLWCGPDASAFIIPQVNQQVSPSAFPSSTSPSASASFQLYSATGPAASQGKMQGQQPPQGAGDAYAAKKETLKRVLRREYASFFNPMEREYYTKEVEFIDPMIKIKGVDSYQSNVDLLGGRTLLGKVLFSDQGIVLHNIVDLEERRLMTRWTLRLRAKMLPWGPTARFTGVSIYDLDEEAKVLRQTDYWDSVNLDAGEYKAMATLDGVKDFLKQLSPQSQAQAAMNSELPYELLRRAKEYEVRRYPAYEAVETFYETRPEGYDLLGTYVGGWNEENRKVRPFSPSIIRVSSGSGEGGDRKKRMMWPVGFSNQALAQTGGVLGDSSVPTPSSTTIRRVSMPSQTVAVLRFENPATEPVVKYYSRRLAELLKADGLGVSAEGEAEFRVAQYDAIFSIGTRRNEVWAVLDKHDWL